MGGIEIKPDIVPEGGWAHQAADLVVLMTLYPWQSLILFLVILTILAMLPGGAIPGWIRYRGAKREQEQRQELGVEHTIELLGKRAQKRQRGRAKGRKK